MRSLIGDYCPYSCPVLMRMRVVPMRLSLGKKSDRSCHREVYSEVSEQHLCECNERPT